MDLFHNSLINLPESTNDYISNVVQTKLPNTYGFLAVIVIFLFKVFMTKLFKLPLLNLYIF